MPDVSLPYLCVTRRSVNLSTTFNEELVTCLFVCLYNNRNESFDYELGTMFLDV